MNRKSAAKLLKSLKLYGERSTTSLYDVLLGDNRTDWEMGGNVEFIYVLTNPNSFKIRYVGRTKNPDRRLSSHIRSLEDRGGGTHKRNWIKKLQQFGKVPDLYIIDFSKEDKIDELETFYIKMLSKYYKLTNFYKIHRSETYFKRCLDIGAKPVYEFDLDGNFLKKYTTTRQCSIENNITTANISCCINRKERCSYTNTYFFRAKSFHPKKGPGKGSPKKVYMFDDNLKIIKVFKTILIASKELNINSGGIRSAINQGTRYKGYRFSYKQILEAVRGSRGDHNSKQVDVWNLDGKYLGRFKSSVECQTKLNCIGISISSLIKEKGVSKKHKLKFEYVEDMV